MGKDKFILKRSSFEFESSRRLSTDLSLLHRIILKSELIRLKHRELKVYWSSDVNDSFQIYSTPVFCGEAYDFNVRSFFCKDDSKVPHNDLHMSTKRNYIVAKPSD